LEAFDMELTDRMIEKYLKSSKKQKSQMITQYCELTHVKRTTAVKRFERRKKKYLFKEGKTNRIHLRKEGQRRSTVLYIRVLCINVGDCLVVFVLRKCVRCRMYTCVCQSLFTMGVSRAAGLGKNQ
jgi:hypothetical protein